MVLDHPMYTMAIGNARSQIKKDNCVEIMMELFEALQDSKEQELLTLFEKAVDLSAFHLRSMFKSGRAKIIHDNLLPVVIEKSLQFHLGD